MGVEFDLGAMEMMDLELPLPQSYTGSLRRSGSPPPHQNAACAAPPCGAAGSSSLSREVVVVRITCAILNTQLFRNGWGVRLDQQCAREEFGQTTL